MLHFLIVVMVTVVMVSFWREVCYET